MSMKNFFNERNQIYTIILSLSELLSFHLFWIHPNSVPNPQRQKVPGPQLWIWKKITIFFVVAEVADEQADLGPVYWQPRSFHATQEAGSNGGEFFFWWILNCSISGILINWSYWPWQCCGTVTIFYGFGSGSYFWKVMVRFRFRLLKKLWFRFRFLLLKSYGSDSGSGSSSISIP